MELESFRLIYESKMTKTSLLPSDWKCDTGSGHFHPPTLKTTRGEWDPDEIVYSLLFILKSGPKWPPDCISVSTSGQRCRKWWCQLRPIRLLLCREGAGLRAICNSCWQRLPPTVLLHSSTWYSCINRPFTGSPTTGRDNALPCSTHTSCQVSCLTNRKTPVMFKSRMLGPQTLHHCWIILGFSCDYRSVGISCVEGKTNRTQWGPETTVSLVMHICPLVMRH